MENPSSGDKWEPKSRVKVNVRALVDKILARYPEKFAVFRELLQNADDAGATEVVIEFQTEKFAHASDEATKNDCADNLLGVELFRLVIRNNGHSFTEADWNRLGNVAEGNPNEQKIGAFGVGFFSVFSLTEKPIVMSGGKRKKMFFDEDNELFEQSGSCGRHDGWTIFQIDLKIDVSRSIPNTFDLTRYISAAVTFLASVTRVTVLFNGSLLSNVRKTSETPMEIDVPEHLERSHASMMVKTVQMIRQKVEVTISALAYTVESGQLPRFHKKAEPSIVVPFSRDSEFFEENAEEDTDTDIIQTRPSSQRVFSAQYTVYSAVVVCNASDEMKRGIRTATMKDPPEEFRVQAMHLSMKEYEDASGDDGDLRAVFMGPKGLLSSQEHGARLFIGQSTDQTTGIAIHLSSRFIPTVERGLIDLTNGQVQKWNEELLYVGGLMTRLIYERAMDAVRNIWLSETDQAREEGLFIMKAFKFHPSTPNDKVGDILRNAFFECSTKNSLPIVSSHGIQESKGVRLPDPHFALFMKNQPVLDDSPTTVTSTVIGDLPKQYKVSGYTWRDVQGELKGRVLTQDEMIALVEWLVDKFNQPMTEKERQETEGRERTKKAIIHAAKFEVPFRQPAKLHHIKKFVDLEEWESYVGEGNPLPADTIALRLVGRSDAKGIISKEPLDLDVVQTRFDPDALQKTFGWQTMSITDWTEYLTNGQDLDHDHNVRLSPSFSKKVFTILQSSWVSPELDKSRIIEQLRDVQCIPTNRGCMKPGDVYFPEANLFGDLPVVDIPNPNKQMLEELGVKKRIEWASVKQQLSHSACAPHKLAAYLHTAYTNMDNEECKELQGMQIFECEGGGRRCITDLYVADKAGLHLKLGLPVVNWRDASGAVHPQDALTPLIRLGLKEYPDLDVIIENACSQNKGTQQDAFNFFISNLEKLYPSYNPENFPKAAFIPCGSTTDARLASPERVVLSPQWEPLGFERPHSRINTQMQTLLKIKDHPSPSAIVDALKSNKPKTSEEAQSWFEILGEHLPAKHAEELSGLEIVPIDIGDTSLTWIAPQKCILQASELSNEQYHGLFHFVHFNDAAAKFLKACGAKQRPSGADIVQALVRDAQSYHANIKDKGYLDTLCQVGVDFQALPDDLKEAMKNSPIFLGHRRKCGERLPASAGILLPADQIFIADDAEAHRLFQDHVFVAPKEERLENFYKEMGARMLSAHVTRTIEPKEPSTEDGEVLRKAVLEALVIFLHVDEDISRRLCAGFDLAELHKPEKLAVKYCRKLHISTSLHIPSMHQCNPPPVRQGSRAGVEKTKEGNHTLWVTSGMSRSKGTIPVCDISIALCYLLFGVVKPQDKLLLTTILGADPDYLRDHYGIDVIPILEKWREKSSQLETEPTPEPVVPVPPSPIATRERHKPRRHPGILFISRIMWSFRPRGHFKLQRWNTNRRTCGEMEDLVDCIISKCTSGNTCSEETVHQVVEKAKGGRKLRDVKHCSLVQKHLEPCADTQGLINVFKTCNSTDPHPEELEKFSHILLKLSEVFSLKPAQIRIFWQSDNEDLMGFNNGGAIYLSLAYFSKEHYRKLLSDRRDDKVAVYSSWFFIIAHEIAHNEATLHDEEHEQWLVTIARCKLTAFWNLLNGESLMWIVK